MNDKYSLNIPNSNLDQSELSSNYWFSSFTEVDGHFGVRYVEFKPKSKDKWSVSQSIRIWFRLDQRAYDHSVSLSLSRPIMEKIALFLQCNLLTYKLKRTKEPSSTMSEVLSVSVSSIDKLKPLINYFNNFPLLGIKGKEFKDLEIIFLIILSSLRTLLLLR